MPTDAACHCVPPGRGACGGSTCVIVWCLSSKQWLSARAEGDDASHWIVGRNPDSDPVPWHHFDAEPAHAAAQLRKNFVALIALHPIEAATVDGHHGALHVNKIVLTQLFLIPFNQRLCHTTRRIRKLSGEGLRRSGHKARTAASTSAARAA